MGIETIGGETVRRQIGLTLTAAVLALAALTNCSTQPTSIAADDEALCRYAAASADVKGGEPQSYSRCRARIDQKRGGVLASNATAIQGYALVKTPTDVANPCAAPGAPKDCSPDDLTGSIKQAPKQ